MEDLCQTLRCVCALVYLFSLLDRVIVLPAASSVTHGCVV